MTWLLNIWIDLLSLLSPTILSFSDLLAFFAFSLLLDLISQTRGDCFIYSEINRIPTRRKDREAPSSHTHHSINQFDFLPWIAQYLSLLALWFFFKLRINLLHLARNSWIWLNWPHSKPLPRRTSAKLPIDSLTKWTRRPEMTNSKRTESA